MSTEKAFAIHQELSTALEPIVERLRQQVNDLPDPAQREAFGPALENLSKAEYETYAYLARIRDVGDAKAALDSGDPQLIRMELASLYIKLLKGIQET